MKKIKILLITLSMMVSINQASAALGIMFSAPVVTLLGAFSIAGGLGASGLGFISTRGRMTENNIMPLAMLLPGGLLLDSEQNELQFAPINAEDYPALSGERILRFNSNLNKINIIAQEVTRLNEENEDHFDNEEDLIEFSKENWKNNWFMNNYSFEEFQEDLKIFREENS